MERYVADGIKQICQKYLSHTSALKNRFWIRGESYRPLGSFTSLSNHSSKLVPEHKHAAVAAALPFFCRHALVGAKNRFATGKASRRER